MTDPLIRAYLNKLESEEILPTVPEIPGVSFQTYLATVMERFSNAAVGDTISRLCLDGSNRQPKFILPVILERLDNNLNITGLALETALWCRYCLGNDEAGQEILLEDENADCLKAWAKSTFSESTATVWPELFGPLATDTVFLAEFEKAVDKLQRFGVTDTLADYVSGP
ncbi:hypothetical protein [Labrenzia sp. DG1229]|uniref:mannitol dehydrogenase family protein n=1 Tax=Labrenzia sp. DG1229 TaxID=681847 RepID=UPI000A724738